jgi:hypothetical protein
MNERAISDVRARHMPAATPIFVTDPDAAGRWWHSRRPSNGTHCGLPARRVPRRDLHRTESGIVMSAGRDITLGAALVIIVAGALGEASNQGHAPALPVVKPTPQPVHTEVVHTVTTHVVTKVVSGSPLSGWEIMFIVIAAIIVAGGTAIALHSRRPLWLPLTIPGITGSKTVTRKSSLASPIRARRTCCAGSNLPG